MTSLGRSVYETAFVVSPIILTGGVAGNILGGMLPIISITESISFLGGILSSGAMPPPGSFFAAYSVIPGSKLIDNQYGTYPFANQSVAANAVITQPLTLSMKMTLQVRQYSIRLAIITALQATLQQHTTSGGTYTVATPSYIATNQLLLGLTDISPDDPSQQQTVFRWDFFAPLITQQQAANAQSQLMSSISNGTPTNGDWSGPASTVGFQNSLATTGTVPASSGLTGASAAGAPYMLGGPVVQ
jgi:hypothetical protein